MTKVMNLASKNEPQNQKTKNLGKKSALIYPLKIQADTKQQSLTNPKSSSSSQIPKSSVDLNKVE